MATVPALTEEPLASFVNEEVGALHPPNEMQAAVSTAAAVSMPADYTGVWLTAVDSVTAVISRPPSSRARSTRRST